MANMYINDMTALWNSGGTFYSAIKMNVTNAASAADSRLIDLQVAAVEKFTVDREGDVYLAGSITATGSVTTGGAHLPSSNDGAALGASGTAWSDLFLASGGVINWNAGDITLTHSAELLTVGGGNLALGGSTLTVGTEAPTGAFAIVRPGTASMTSVYGGQNAATGAYLTLYGSTHASQANDIVLGTAAANRYLFDHSANAHYWYNNAGTQSATLNVDGALTTAGSIVSNQIFTTTTSAAIIGPGSAGAIYLRPGGPAVTTGEWSIASTGSVTMTGAQMTAGSSTAGSGFIIDRPIANGFTDVYGGTTSSTGAFLRLIGASHATQGGDFVLGATNNYRYFWDESAATHAWANGPTQLMSLNTTALTVNAPLQMGSNVINCAYYQSYGGIILGCVASGGAINLRPYGVNNGTYEAYHGQDGIFRAGCLHASGATSGSHSFYNGNGAVGSGSFGCYICGNGAPNTAAGFFISYPGGGVMPNAHVYLAFHQPSIAYWAIHSVGPNITTQSWQVSDAKVKSNIADCDCGDAYHKVMAIGVKSYRKEGGAYSRQSVDYDEMGFLAQDIETVIPEAVMDVPVPRQDDKGRPLEPTESIKATNDRTLLGMLWAAVQHQSHLIEHLESKITALEKK